MLRNTKRYLTTLAVGSALVVATAGPAAAQQQNGLVNVFIGDDVVNVEDVNVGVAAHIAATIFDVKVVPVAVLRAAVDRDNVTRTVCTTEQGPVTLRQD